MFHKLQCYSVYSYLEQRYNNSKLVMTVKKNQNLSLDFCKCNFLFYNFRHCNVISDNLDHGSSWYVHSYVEALYSLLIYVIYLKYFEPRFYNSSKMALCYLTALSLSTVTNISLSWTMLMLNSIAILYTMMGGMKVKII